jgi:glucokinase
LINDFEAIGYGIDQLGPTDLYTLQEAKPNPQGNRGILGAGTGLGQAFMVKAPIDYQVHGCEGGHVDFAPNNEDEIELLRFLNARYGHVSYERILSGQGLQNIYQFLVSRHPEQVDKAFHTGLTGSKIPALISQKAMNDPDPITAGALEMFIRIYGAQAGNMALNYNCSGGVYIAGGIAAKIAATMDSDTFRRAFNNKGRMSKLTAQTPVFLITNEQVGLLGAEYVALRSIK